MDDDDDDDDGDDNREDGPSAVDLAKGSRRVIKGAKRQKLLINPRDKVPVPKRASYKTRVVAAQQEDDNDINRKARRCKICLCLCLYFSAQ